jgi:hypothetical protein
LDIFSFVLPLLPCWIANRDNTSWQKQRFCRGYTAASGTHTLSRDADPIPPVFTPHGLCVRWPLAQEFVRNLIFGMFPIKNCLNQKHPSIHATQLNMCRVPDTTSVQSPGLEVKRIELRRRKRIVILGNYINSQYINSQYSVYKV